MNYSKFKIYQTYDGLIVNEIRVQCRKEEKDPTVDFEESLWGEVVYKKNGTPLMFRQSEWYDEGDALWSYLGSMMFAVEGKVPS